MDGRVACGYEYGPVEKDVVIPDAWNGAPSKYGFHELAEVGQSRLYKVKAGDRKSKVRLQMAAHRYATRTGRIFMTREVSGGVRVWRRA